MEAHSNVRQDLHVLDLRTSERRQLTDDEGTRYASVNWGPDGDALYLVTDTNADTRYVARLDLETCALDPVVEGGDWNVEGVNVHPSGRVVYGRNVDGWSEVTVGQLVGDRTVEPTTTPELPRGVVGELTVAADGDRAALTHSNRRSPPNVFVFETATRWTDAGIEALPPESRCEPEVVRYESHGAGRDGADHDGVEPGGAEDDVADLAGTDPDESDETTLDVPAFYTEPEDAAYGETPVVVDLHGGPEQQHRPSFNPLVQYFVSRGYGVLEPNVRGSTGYGANYEELDDGRRRLDAIADVAAAVEWLRKRPTVDQDRLAVLGTSYGGFPRALDADAPPREVGGGRQYRRHRRPRRVPRIDGRAATEPAGSQIWQPRHRPRVT